MPIPKSTHIISGIEVSVECEKLEGTFNPSYRFRAMVGDISYEHTLTVGSRDGDTPIMTLEQLQSDIDSARTYAAKQAHLRHVVASLEDKIT